ncbi:MAG: protein of unknown function DUF111 [Deltaproteobacteria bacterium]|nr:protein of unknown function DUF111 [Deltaproteobacteria bacterium]
MIAYFDCFSGISGDMIVGAFLDAGVPFEWLKDELVKLPLKGYKLGVEDVKRGGIGGKKFQVEIKEEQVERRLGDIRKIIENSALSHDVKANSLKIFERLAEAEARVHRVGVDDVHFHEVGGVDSVIDIVAASLSLSFLKIKEVYASEIPVSHGTIASSHGRLPLPAPATMELLKDVPVYQSSTTGELVTPTGAAFISVVSKGFGSIRPMRLKGIGYGAGERENEGLPNLLRVLIGEKLPPTPSLVKRGSKGELEADSVMVVESNIDDMNPEIYGYVMDRLFDEGALDVSLIPVYMKKGRPGTIVQVLCETGMERALAEVILKETSTIGVRYYRTDRLKLQRETVEVKTRFGTLRAKMARAPWGNKARPEYEDCRKLAMDMGVPLLDVYTEAVKEVKENDE